MQMLDAGLWILDEKGIVFSGLSPLKNGILDQHRASSNQHLYATSYVNILHLNLFVMRRSFERKEVSGLLDQLN